MPTRFPMMAAAWCWAAVVVWVYSCSHLLPDNKRAVLLRLLPNQNRFCVFRLYVYSFSLYGIHASHLLTTQHIPHFPSKVQTKDFGCRIPLPGKAHTGPQRASHRRFSWSPPVSETNSLYACKTVDKLWRAEYHIHTW